MRRHDKSTRVQVDEDTRRVACIALGRMMAVR